MGGATGVCIRVSGGRFATSLHPREVADHLPQRTANIWQYGIGGIGLYLEYGYTWLGGVRSTLLGQPLRGERYRLVHLCPFARGGHGQGRTPQCATISAAIIHSVSPSSSRTTCDDDAKHIIFVN